MPLTYHPGQIAIQAEARTLKLAEHLAHWVGPVAQFTCEADLLLFAQHTDAGHLRYTVISGPPPLVQATGPASFRLRLPATGPRPVAGRAGVLAINLGTARRARVNGELHDEGTTLRLDADETFTLCRKYMAPSIGMGDAIRVGPSSRAPLPVDSPLIAELLARAECTFLASASPDGNPDVAHRGGPPGFIKLDPATRTLAWPELLGDGVFKSAGNVRATGYLTLLVPDFDSGDGIELVCNAARYTSHRTSRHERLDALLEDTMPYPIQGEIVATIVEASRLSGLLHPRRRTNRTHKVTSCSPVDVQAPQ